MDHKKEIKERERLKSEFGHVFTEVSKLLFMIDPMEIAFVDNFDEYDSEVATILRRVKGIREKDRIEVIVREEFHRWFDLSDEDDLADETYANISCGIAEILIRADRN